MNDLDQLIRELEGVDYFNVDTETRYPGLIIISLSIIAWAAVGGIGYAVYQAVWGA